MRLPRILMRPACAAYDWFPQHKQARSCAGGGSPNAAAMPAAAPALIILRRSALEALPAARGRLAPSPD